ncbi:hypothetical protein BV22DRAFT_297584 [Leucogyrophana mollusca]|uniref:Uncharacterized protein n=1 Tax=Leucogyrophana mollusca TaxID=85980 RepID=A0ACB8BMU0_9AGAM|nr:hypothetical protein BV22DRAFT_297584 [Leucogyrophana mollusca]
MAAGKSQKAKQPARTAPASNPCPPAPSVPPQAAPPPASKKNKKKKSTGTTTIGTPSTPTPHGDDDTGADSGDEIPALEELDMPPPSVTGLPPALESVHITTTACLSASAAIAARSGPGAAAQVQSELLATANDLYRSIEIQHGVRHGGKSTQAQIPLPKAPATAGGVSDDEYWSSFPPHIKNFAQTMYNIAQQMVQSDALLKNGVGAATATATMATKGIPGYPPGAYPPLPFDPSIFSDPAFTLSVEQAAAAALGAAPPAPGRPPRGPLPPTNVVLLNEFGEEHEYADDDYYSEDGVDGDFDDEALGDEFDLQPRPARPMGVPYPGTFPGSLPDTVAQVVLSYGEAFPRSAPPPTNHSTHKTSTAATEQAANPPSKKNKKKKNKEQADPPPALPVAPAVPRTAAARETRSAVPAPASAPEMGTPRPTATVDLTKRPPLTANAMPAARAATKENSNPPPSSRAAGKQPMSYAPANTTSTTTTTATTTATGNVNGQQPARTARAASKAPIPAHAYQHNHAHHHPSPPSSNASAPHKPRPPAGTGPNKGTPNNSKIWSTSSTEERERIKEFWLGLGEDERRNLVKIEKDTVLRKMKEQQKHSCSCAVCGRKRHAIEEELEVLYDAYYEELEQYANYQQRYVSSGGTIPPPPGPGPFPGSVELDKNGAVIGHHHNKAPHHPPRSNRTPALTNGRKPPKHAESEFDDDEGDEEEFEEEEEYEEEDEDEDEDEEEDAAEEEEEDVKVRERRTTPARARRPVNGAKANGRDGLFNLGNSLTVTGPGNILTVADDLLKNDGQKFLEMMEQLAERRMQREEEAAADVEDESEDDDDDEGDEDEDDDEEDEEDEDEDDEEVMTEEQKMEEGKRMFSIFAARMFEQRVLQAYREKVAQERQLQLLRELEDEDKLSKEREAKKQNQNQKKKDKKKLQKQAKEEERAAKAAEKAAEEAALKAKQLAQEEEQRKKREEDRARREAARKAAEEEKQRKEEERRKRLAEEREREAERERKRKEREEKAKQERREREEKERKIKEEKEAKAAAEKAARDAARKEQEKEKEEREKKLAKEREEKAEKERTAQQQQQRASTKNPRPPTSPRNVAASGSSQRAPTNNGASKKILNKPAPAPAASSSTPRQQQPQRPIVSTSQPSTPVAPPVQNHFPSPSTPLYPHSTGMMHPQGAMSPRLPFAPPPPPPFGVFGPGPPMQPGPPLAPSALARNFGSPSPFETTFNRGLAPAAPIGPPSKVVQNVLASPTMLAPDPSRRASIPEPGPGPVARPVSIAPIASTVPIAPIARPTTGETSASGSGSPSRRSPSPKGVLGSSALAADDDEVVPPPGRRVAPGAVGQSWGNNTSPRTAVGDNRAPWGAPAPPGFGSPRPPMATSLWGNVNPSPEWQSPGNFYPNSFVNHVKPSPPPHASTGN